MRPILLLTLAALLAACGSPRQTPTPLPNLSALLLADLDAHEIAYTLSGPSQLAWLDDAPGASYHLVDRATPEYIFIHTYPDEASAQARRKQIPPSADDGITDWVNQPHFFQCVNIIALYLGQDAELLELLTERCGPQFAGP